MTTAVTPRLATGHIGLNVSQLDRSLRFYRDVLGFDELATGADADRRWAFLGAGGELALTLWQQSAGEFPVDRPGLHHLSFQVSSVEQVRQVEAALTAREVTFFHDGVVAHGEGAASGGIFFADPDGIRLEVYTPAGVESAPAPSGAAPTCGFF
ncbi:VOC family protein [Nocardia sp. NPDC004568]|uniref:VOC family protein n=1 Tax=Nocardia sp. NPDC004568 TaxID=3154551 RepID=UPI0033A47961